ncbi:Flap endonuclease 1 [Galdieria sulphuraria]|nr:Flap endonuclease 1 [Galdieria sulphuraria]
MGIKGLTKLLGDYAPSCVQQQELKNYFGRKIAIDASMNIYQFLSAVRAGADNLRNEAGEVTSHLSGLFYRTTRLMELGIMPCYVFDGKPPELKSGELSKRIEARRQAEASAALAKEEGDVEAYEKFNRRVNKVSPEVIEQSKRLLRLMGIPILEAPEEAEAQCASLCKENLVYATASEDMDSLTFGSPKVIRQLWVGATSTAEKKGIHPLEFSLEKALLELNFSYEQFIDLCILCGCDYLDSIRGIGPYKAFNLIRKHGNLEGALEEIKEKHDVPDHFPYDKARELFLKPKVHSPSSVVLEWSPPDEQGIIQMLVHESNFNEDNIRKALKRLAHSKHASSQGRLENFFSIKPKEQQDPSTDKKRKAPVFSPKRNKRR